MASGGTHCSAASCKNYKRKQPELSFFTFPKDKERCYKWIIGCQRKDLLDIFIQTKSTEYFWRNCRLCSVHFEDSCFMNAVVRNRLTHTAVPTIFNVAYKPQQSQGKKRSADDLDFEDNPFFDISQKTGRYSTMNEEALRYAERLVPGTYLKQATEARKSTENLIKVLMDQRKCPKEGWTDSAIEYLLKDLSLMDSNNFPHNSGVGEREARIYSGLVAQRHYRLGHGIGRSGDLMEIQPKATGSSLLYQLTNSLALDLIKAAGVQTAAACLLVPMATGMSLALCLLTLRSKRPKAKYVIWPRIDQKSCIKAITTTGFVPIVVENLLVQDELRTDVEKIEELISTHDSEDIAAVVTTTSCFAPRGIDKLEEVAKLCQHHGIPHLVNNAYGVQSSKCMHHIQQAARVGRIDAFVQSTDKNFMVPVGGALVVGFDRSFIQAVGRMYPGRASMSPVLDLFITMLSMGVDGYKDLLAQRKELKEHLQEQMSKVAEKHGLRVLKTKNNPISVALMLPAASDGPVTQLGSMLFLRGISGVRVVSTKELKTVTSVNFKGWGSHYNDYPHPYLTAAASVGMKKEDVSSFIRCLDSSLAKWRIARGKQAQVYSSPQAAVQSHASDSNQRVAASNARGESGNKNGDGETGGGDEEEEEEEEDDSTGSEDEGSDSDDSSEENSAGESEAAEDDENAGKVRVNDSVE